MKNGRVSGYLGAMVVCLAIAGGCQAGGAPEGVSSQEAQLEEVTLVLGLVEGVVAPDNLPLGDDAVFFRGLRADAHARYVATAAKLAGLEAKPGTRTIRATLELGGEERTYRLPMPDEQGFAELRDTVKLFKAGSADMPQMTPQAEALPMCGDKLQWCCFGWAGYCTSGCINCCDCD